MTHHAPDRRLAIAPDAAADDAPLAHRILFVEDNRINQVVGAGVLKKLGFEVRIVDDGRAAVDACIADDYAAVLMDVMMPEVDGYLATRMIRAFEMRSRLRPVPIIGLSARALPGDREMAIEAGMNDYLTKPLRTSELAIVLERWVNPVTLAAAGDRGSA